MTRLDTRSRFYAHVRVVPGPGCWEWTGGRQADGYGAFSMGGRAARRMVGAHRISWELANGTIPEGMSVMHRCDNPPCVRPSHLELGSRADNMRDMARKERSRTTRLTAPQVNEIRVAVAKGERHIDIVTRYGISKANVSMIVTRQTWRHLPDVRDLIALLGGETA